MKELFASMTLEKKLALLALVLGLLAVVAGDPYRGTAASIDTKELGLIVGNEVDHVSVDDLAGWIIQGRVDFRLIDLRSEKEFGAYHIPQAELVPMASLAEYGLSRNDKIVLYSDGGIHSAQAWFLLKARDFQGVYILRGGLEEWKDRILFPVLADGASAHETAQFERRASIAKFFGGSPRSGRKKELTSPSMEMPKLSAPPPGAIPAATGGTKKKKEGC